jgi:hypothetical protein
MDQEQVRRLQAALEALSPALAGQNDVPKTAMAGIGDEAAEARKRFLTGSDLQAMREGLQKLSTPQLLAMFSDTARRRDQGVPVDAWIAAGGNSYAVGQAFESDPVLRKALDTSAGSALIRQDLEPILYELYIRQFPAWDRFGKEPSNGLVHAYNRQTGYGDAEFMSELGVVTDDRGAYERATTPITTIATRRGVTLRDIYATRQGGAGFNPEQLELQAGLRAVSHRMQMTIFQGNSTTSGGAGSSTENGEFNSLAFDGLRKLLKGPTPNDPEDVDPTGGSPEDMRAAINDAVIAATQNAGNPKIAYLDPIAKGQFDKQQDANVHYNNPPSLVNVAVGVVTNVVNTANGPIPLFVVPGDSIGEYTHGGDTVSDIYLLDEDNISLPFLGSDGPQVLDIPMGVSGQLTRLFIIFGMWGFAVKAVQFHNKVRVVRE